MVNGLYLADSIGNLMQSEINGYMYWALRNGPPTINNNTSLDGNMSSALYGWRQFGDYGMISSPSTLTGETTYYNPYPTYYVMKLLSKFARGGDSIVQATSNNPLLSVFAARRTDDSLGILVINKDRYSTQNANVALTGFSSSGLANVYSYGIAQDDAARTGVGSPDLSSTIVSLSAGNFSSSFLPYSATVISLASGSAPSITMSPTAQTVTAGSSVTFNASASGSPVPMFQWQKNGVNIAGATSNSYTIARALVASAGTYTVVVTNSLGSATSAGANLAVRSILPGDFNGDGQTDILWENTASGDRGLWIMTGSVPSAWINLPSIALNWRIAGIGDFNGDAQTDILWENASSGDHGIWIMKGTTPTAWINLPSIALNWRIVGTGDFNGDGQTDILWENVGSGDRGIWIMDGTVPAAWINLPSIALDWRIVGTGDFNGDGQTDILWENVGSGDRGIWIMNGTVPAAWINLPSIALKWRIAGTGDFNGDGMTDILWENDSSGDRGMWIMNATVPAAWINLPSLPLDWRIAQ